MGEHILQRRGPKRWPPQFFTGEGGGCSCCAPPPPPPPPPANPPYYYLGRSCKCFVCGDDRTPCKFLLEVEGFANGSGSFPAGSNCANNNGSFILEKIEIFPNSCLWRGPVFTTTTFIPSTGGGATCNNSGSAFWQYEVSFLNGYFFVARLYDATSMIVQAEYIVTITGDGYDCGTRVLLGNIVYYTGTDYVCCFEFPSTVTIYPLF